MTGVGPDVAPAVEEAGRFPLIFLHAGNLLSPATVVSSLTSTMSDDGRAVAVIDISKSSYQCAAGTSVLIGFERLATRADRCERLAKARSSVMAGLQAGGRFVAVSEVPKLRLLGCPGSQLIIDARTVFLPRVPDDDVRGAMASAGLKDASARFLTNMCAGLPALVDAALSAVSETEDDQAATRSAVMMSVQRTLVEAVRQLGVAGIVALQDLTSRGEWEFDEGSLDPLILEALRGAGMAELGAETGEVSLLNARLRKHALGAVRTAADTCVEPPEDIGLILTGLWEIERRIRRAVQQRAVGHHGVNWTSAVLGSSDLRQRVLLRVQADRAARVVVDDVANPLEWMTLSEVLELLEREAEWACPPDTPPAFFRRLGTDLEPVRNRAAHFRLPQLRDAETVLRWKQDVRRRFAVADSDV